MLEMLLEVCDSSMTYRSRYFTVLQAAPVLDLLMNDEANPRSLAFQIKDLSEHCRALARTLQARNGRPRNRAGGRGRARTCSTRMFGLCQPDPTARAAWLDNLLGALDTALPAFSDAITNTYFSHAEMERPA